jgi:hypothetical protein
MLFRYCIRSTFHDVPIFATRHALSKNLAASVVNEGFGAFNFYMGRGLWHSAPDVSILIGRATSLE